MTITRRTVDSVVKILPAMQETWVGSLDWGDPIEK